jgi:uncharacterized membrane protein
MNSSLWFSFLVYGMVGWATEIVWTALGRQLSGHGDWSLEGHTYLWMFPLYGSLSILFVPVHAAVAVWPWWMRGIVYATGLMLAEYGSGWLLRRITGRCPWDYTGRCRHHLHGLVRLDYAPAWFAAGLGLELLQGWLAGVRW